MKSSMKSNKLPSYFLYSAHVHFVNSWIIAVFHQDGQERLMPLSLSCLSRKDPEGQITLKSHFPLFSLACLGLIKALHHQNLHFHIKWERGADISIFMNTDALNHVKLRTQGKPASCQVLSQIAYDMWAEQELGHILQDFRQRGLLLKRYKYFARSQFLLQVSHLWAKA